MTQIERRQFWTAIHRYSGLAMLAFLAIAAATGCLLCFEKPLDAWLNPELFAPSSPALIQPLAAVERLERDHPELVATVATGDLPHGLWPSGDGTRIYVGLENADAVTAIDSLSNKVVATISSGQSPQGMVYIPNAVPNGDGTENLSPISTSGEAVHLSLVSVGTDKVQTTVAVNNQGLIDLLR